MPPVVVRPYLVFHRVVGASVVVRFVRHAARNPAHWIVDEVARRDGGPTP